MCWWIYNSYRNGGVECRYTVCWFLLQNAAGYRWGKSIAHCPLKYDERHAICVTRLLPCCKNIVSCEMFSWRLWFENTGLFKMFVGVFSTCHTQYTWDSSICIFLFNRTTLQVFVPYLTGALCVHFLWFYKHQHENRVRSKLFVACQLFAVRRHLSKLRSKRRNA